MSLIKILDHYHMHYGIRGVANKWICSCLMNIIQYICINDTSSECMNVTEGSARSKYYTNYNMTLYFALYGHGSRSDRDSISPCISSISIGYDTTRTGKVMIGHYIVLSRVDKDVQWC